MCNGYSNHDTPSVDNYFQCVCRRFYGNVVSGSESLKGEIQNDAHYDCVFNAQHRFCLGAKLE